MEDNATVRRNLANAHRAIAWYGMQHGIFNHNTALARAKSGNGHVILMAPFGFLWQEITAERLLGLDPITGEVVEGRGNVYNDGKCVHMAIYKHRPDVKAIMHVHPTYATSLSCLKDRKLLMTNQASIRYYDDVAYDDDYAGLGASSNNEGDRLSQALGDKSILMMGNHGVATVGSTVAVAFDNVHGFEVACKIQMIAMNTGKELQVLSDEVARGVKQIHESFLERSAQMHLDAVRRYLDRIEPQMN